LMKDSRTCAEVIVGILCPFIFSGVKIEIRRQILKSSVAAKLAWT